MNILPGLIMAIGLLLLDIYGEVCTCLVALSVLTEINPLVLSPLQSNLPSCYVLVWFGLVFVFFFPSARFRFVWCPVSSVFTAKPDQVALRFSCHSRK